MTILLLWGCGFGFTHGEDDMAPMPQSPPTQAEPSKPAFDPLPDGIELILEPAGFHAAIQPYRLGPSLASNAQTVKFNTAVMVDQMAAVRTGAELGALMVEAGHQDPDVIRARLARIQAGLDAIREDGPAQETLEGLAAAVASGTTGDAWVRVLQTSHGPIQTEVAAHLGADMVPLLLAGAWMQGALLTVQAMREEGRLDAGPALLYRPQVGTYFQTYVAQAGTDIFPVSALTGIQGSLAELRKLSQKDPMTPADAKAIQDTLEGLLGMI